MTDPKRQSLKLRILSTAEAEAIVETCRHDDQSLGLAEQFIAEHRAALTAIEQLPLRFG